MRLLKTLLVSCLILVSSFGAGYAVVSAITGDDGLAGQAQDGLDDVDSPKDLNRLNILLLGVDARPGESDARTDTMIVASIDPSTNKVALLSIPRDTRVEIPKRGTQKINAANEIGGVELAKEIVENLIDIKIDYYVKTNFNGFPQIVDTLGGVTLDVEKNMYYRDKSDGTLINLKQGEQTLSGKEALDYARFRHDALGDISRTQRQQKLLSALMEQSLQASTVLKLPKLIPQIMDVVETDMSFKAMMNLAKLAKDFSEIQIVTQTLPGQFYNHKGSYWKADEQLARGIMEKMLNGEELGLITGPDINLNKPVVAHNTDTKSSGQSSKNNNSTEKKEQQTPPKPKDKNDQQDQPNNKTENVGENNNLDDQNSNESNNEQNQTLPEPETTPEPKPEPKPEPTPKPIPQPVQPVEPQPVEPEPVG